LDLQNGKAQKLAQRYAQTTFEEKA